VEILEVDILTGRRTRFATDSRKAMRALMNADVAFAVIGATALAARGLPRMTQDLDLVVTTDDALDALTRAGYASVAPVDREQDPEAMYVLMKSTSEVDLLVASGEPESTVVAEATATSVFGVQAPTATLEHLVLMYLYSNQLRHHGDLARIVLESKVDLALVERYLAEVHPEMLPVLRDHVHAIRHPPSPPPRPTRTKKR
jgi:hypothetical protein